MTEVSLRPLAGIKVLDLTRVRAGPTAVRQLVDWGADAIKIESPAALAEGTDMGGPRDTSDFQNLNVGKRSLTLNLKDPAGLELFYRLVETADVVVENYRPDVKSRLRIDYDSLAAVNPRIVYASISGFGQDGPYAKRPGFDQIVQGMSGLMSITGHAGTPPVRVGIAIADSVSGQMCAQGIILALYERMRSGRGQWVQVSLLETLINLLDFQAARWLNEGDLPEQVGNDHATRMPTSAYATADGYLTICAAADGMWKKLCRAMGRSELLEDERFIDQHGRSSNRAALNAELARTFATRETGYWVDVLNEAGVACGPILRIDQMLEDPHVRHLNPVHSIDHPRLGEMRVLGQPIRLSRSPQAPKTAAPDHGAHTDEILRELGLSDEMIQDLKQQVVV